MQDSARTKVCFVVTKGVWYGAQKYVYALATNLPKEQYDVLVICGEGDALPDKLDAAGIRVVRLPKLKRDISLIAEYKSSLALLKIIREEKPDVLHLNSAKASGMGAVAGRLSQVKHIIYTVHGFAFNEERSTTGEGLIWFFSWLTILLCHKVIVINEKEKAQALSMPFISEKKIVLIHNGVQKITFKEKNVAREKLSAKISKHFGDDVTWIGTLAELHKNKGLEYIISAVSKIKSPFIFIIIGEGEERKNLEKLILKPGLEEKVFLPGFLENAAQYLSAFDIFTLTSIKEGLPYAVIEAGLAGLPVIASRVGGIPDIIDNGESGILTTKGRAGEITRALEYLLENRDKQKSFGRNLQEKVEKEFSFEQMLEKTFRLY